MEYVEIKDIFLSYDKGKNVLNNINFTINKGEFIALLGSNGAGKSSLMNVLTGFTKPTKGELIYNEVFQIRK